MSGTFPYQGSSLDKVALFKNAMSLDVSPLKVITFAGKKIPFGWNRLPQGVRWGVKSSNQILAFITNGMFAYEQVDILTDAFSEVARMNKCKKGYPSPIEYYRQHTQQIETLAVELSQKRPDLPMVRHRRDAVWQLAKECETFKISITKSLLQHFGANVVLDMSAGHGDRVLGAAAAGMLVYHGFDPATDMRQPYDQMLEFIEQNATVGKLQPNFSQRYQIATADFLTIDLQPKAYDMVFTSPPFYDYEIYADEPTQSIAGKTSLEQWKNEFYYPYLQKAWNALMDGRYFALYIADTAEIKFTEDTNRFITETLGGQLYAVIACADDTLKSASPLWVWQKS